MACEIVVGVNSNNCCLDIESGGIREIVFLRAIDSVTNPLLLADWQAAELAGDTRKFSKVQGSKAVSEATEAPGFGRDSFMITGRDHTLSAKVMFDPTNRDFFNNLNKDSSWYVAYTTETNVFISQAPVSVNADHEIQEDKNTIVTHNMTLKWKTSELDKSYSLAATKEFFTECDA